MLSKICEKTKLRIFWRLLLLFCLAREAKISLFQTEKRVDFFGTSQSLKFRARACFCICCAFKRGVESILENTIGYARRGEAVKMLFHWAELLRGRCLRTLRGGRPADRRSVPVLLLALANALPRRAVS